MEADDFLMLGTVPFFIASASLEVGCIIFFLRELMILIPIVSFCLRKTCAPEQGLTAEIKSS
jgi:hypothetical protein